MGLRDLPTVAQVNAEPRAVPKGATRLETKTVKDKADEHGLDRWRKAVWKRDGVTCRCCGRRVVKTLELQANRREAHHLAGRADKVVRYDERNGVGVCLKCHQDIEAGKVQIIGKASEMFYVNGLARAYLDGSKPLRFVKRS